MGGSSHVASGDQFVRVARLRNEYSQHDRIVRTINSASVLCYNYCIIMCLFAMVVCELHTIDIKLQAEVMMTVADWSVLV